MCSMPYIRCIFYILYTLIDSTVFLHRYCVVVFMSTLCEMFDNWSMFLFHKCHNLLLLSIIIKLAAKSLLYSFKISTTYLSNWFFFVFQLRVVVVFSMRLNCSDRRPIIDECILYAFKSTPFCVPNNTELHIQKSIGNYCRKCSRIYHRRIQYAYILLRKRISFGH